MTRDEILREIDHRIVEAEVRSSTLALEVAALSRADGDPTAMVERLWRAMDGLAELRRQRSAFEVLGRPDPQLPRGDRQ
jgi:hypothetical protein